MSFYDVIKEYGHYDLNAADQAAALKALNKDALSIEDYAALLSPAALPLLEEMARRARDLTMRHFGRTVLLYAPLYLSNYCANRCVYCSFNAASGIPRLQLTPEQAEAEAAEVAATGMRHILILTGDARSVATPEYIISCVDRLKKHFTSIGIEVYAMTRDEYAKLIDAGVDSLTMYQETYDEALYSELHPQGPKRDYRNRLDAPERACGAGMRGVNVGALLGLNRDWRRDAFLTALHADYLQNKFPAAEVGISFPRMRSFAGGDEFHPIKDRELVQAMLAARIFIPRVQITMSTRENAAFRDNLIPLGVTRMSAGSVTSVGGYADRDAPSTGQFNISDERGVQEVYDAIMKAGYQPIFKNWQFI